MYVYISAVTPQGMEVQIGTPVTISCVVTDITAAVTTLWKKSGSSDLSSVTGYTVVQGIYGSNTQTTTLALTAAVNTGDTTYTCVVTPSGGTAGSTLVQLNVFG